MLAHLPRLALLLLSTPVFAQGTLVVDDDGGPGVDFTALQPAIDAAAPGTLILVRDGIYDEFRITSKSLDLVRADAAASVLIEGNSTITGLGPTSQVHLSGLSFNGEGPGMLTIAEPPLQIVQCAGPVMIDRSELRPDQDMVIGLFEDPAQSALGALQSDRVVLSSSTFGISPQAISRAGLELENSTLAGFDSIVFGGQPSWTNGEGNPGLRSISSHLSLSGIQCTGGVGFPQYWELFAGCQPARAGGPGLLLEFGSSAELLGSTLTGGPGGPASTDPNCTLPASGPDGPATEILTGSTVDTVPGQVARRQEFSSPAAAGIAVDLSLEGSAFDQAWLLVSARADLRFSPLTFGATPAAVSESMLIRYLGQLDAAGDLQTSVGTPELPAGLGALFVTQPAFADTAGALVLGNPLTLTLVAPVR